MVLTDAAVWGLIGGATSALIGLSSAIVSGKFRWPWGQNTEELWPRLIVVGIGLTVGAIVAGANHTELGGEWPALIMGASAPSVVRGVLGRVEVTERKPEDRVAL